MKQLGKYQVIELLGSGATADVYRAMDTVLEREVALKVLKPSLVYDNTAYTRFLREARSAANLFHPNIATVLDTAEFEGRYFIAMRYIEGKSLDRILREDGPLPHDEVMRLLKDVGSALQYAHQRGFMHRDIKPSNIIRSMQGEYFLTDFGLVRALMETGMSSHTGAILGTPTYIPPEVWLNQPVTPAVDQYALACVIYEAYTGKILFNGDTPPAIMTAHVLKGYGSLEGLPDAMKVPMQKALSRLAEERYPDIQSFMEALEHLAAPMIEPATTEVAEKIGGALEHPIILDNELASTPLINKEVQSIQPIHTSSAQAQSVSIHQVPSASTPIEPQTGMTSTHYPDQGIPTSTGSKAENQEIASLKMRSEVHETVTPNMGDRKKYKNWFDELFISGTFLPPGPSGKKRSIYWPSLAYFLLLSVSMVIMSEGLWVYCYDVFGRYSGLNYLLDLSLSGLFYGWVFVIILKGSFVIPKPIFIILGWLLAWLVFFISIDGSAYGMRGIIGGLVLSLSLKKSYRLNWKGITFITLAWGIGSLLAGSIIHYGLFNLIIEGILGGSFGSLVTLAVLHQARQQLLELPESTDPSSPNFTIITATYNNRGEKEVVDQKVFSPALIHIILVSSTVWMILSLRYLLGIR